VTPDWRPAYRLSVGLPKRSPAAARPCAMPWPNRSPSPWQRQVDHDQQGRRVEQRVLHHPRAECKGRHERTRPEARNLEIPNSERSAEDPKDYHDKWSVQKNAQINVAHGASRFGSLPIPIPHPNDSQSQTRVLVKSIESAKLATFRSLGVLHRLPWGREAAG
jgi:hypothetical protein